MKTVVFILCPSVSYHPRCKKARSWSILRMYVYTDPIWNWKRERARVCESRRGHEAGSRARPSFRSSMDGCGWRRLGMRIEGEAGGGFYCGQPSASRQLPLIDNKKEFSVALNSVANLPLTAPPRLCNEGKEFCAAANSNHRK